MRGLGSWLRARVAARRTIIVVAHVLLYALAYLFAFLLRFDFSIPGESYNRFWAGLGSHRRHPLRARAQALSRMQWKGRERVTGQDAVVLVWDPPSPVTYSVPRHVGKCMG